METKLNQFGDILYQACREQFGEVTFYWKSAQRKKGRREKEIDKLVLAGFHLRKSWRKATLTEREVLKTLREEVRQRLVRLHRAEHICKRSKRKLKDQASFLKNQFKHATQLLEEKKSKKLKITKE